MFDKLQGTCWFLLALSVYALLFVFAEMGDSFSKHSLVFLATFQAINSFGLACGAIRPSDWTLCASAWKRMRFIAPGYYWMWLILATLLLWHQWFFTAAMAFLSWLLLKSAYMFSKTNAST